MKKIIIACGITLLLCSLVLISCEKEQEQSKNDNLKQRTLSGFNYDLFGEAHNRFLENVYTLHESNDYSAEQIYNSGQNYVDDVFGSFNINQDYETFQNSVSTVETWRNSTVEGTFDASQLVENGYVSEEMSIFLNELSSAFEFAGDHNLTPDEFWLKMEEIESWVMENYSPEIQDNFHCNDAGAMLAISSIAKHSYMYWYNKIGESGEGTSERNIFSRAWRAIKIAACDSYGYINDGWIDTNGDGTKETWRGSVAVAGASERSADVAVKSGY